jgi:oxaloacetate decarboxylase gamma subunit
MDLFMDGLRLMVLGMGMVFGFLVIMILCMSLMSKALAPFVKKIAAKEAAAKAAAAPKAKASSQDTELAAAAVAVVKQFLAK